MYFAIVRLAAAALGVAAIVAQLIRTLSDAFAATTPWGSHIPTVLVNFFSFFTILSNVIAVVAMTIGAVWLWTHRHDERPEPRWYGVLLACATTYMLITGIVYNVLLRGIPLPQGTTVPWANELLHVWVPLLLLADLLFAPRRRALGWGTVGIIAAFPLVWVAYTLIRAPFVTAPATGAPVWYPYPFLNPAQPGGWGAVAAYIAGIAVAIIAIGCIVVGVSRFRARRRERRTGAVAAPA